MSDEAPSEPPQEVPQPGGGHTIQQQVQHSAATARVPEAVGRGVFSTGTIVMHGAHDVLVDFLQSLAPPKRLAARVVLPPTVLPLFVAALEDALDKYVRAFGPPARMPAPPSPGPGELAPTPPPIAEVYDQLKLPDEMLGGAYANTVVISHSPAEFCFDFICSFYPRSVVTSRVYLATPHVPELHDSLKRLWEQFRRTQLPPRSAPFSPPPDG